MSDFSEDLRQRIREEFGMEVDGGGGLDDSTVEKMAGTLVPHAARRMGRSVAAVRRALRRTSLDPGLQIYGQTTSADRWRTFDIRLSTGLLLFHHKMVKLFMSRMTVVGEGNKVVDETGISEDEMLSTSRRLMKAFWELDESREVFIRTPGFSLLQLTKSQIELAAYLLHYADTFVVAHEFGHVLLTASPRRVKRERAIVEGAKESMIRPVLDDHAGGGMVSPEKWVRELEADLIGVGLCRELADNDVVTMVIEASAMMSLVMCDMLEKYYRMSTGRAWDYETHPPSELRLDVMQRLAEWGPTQTLGSAFRQLGDHIMSKL